MSVQRSVLALVWLALASCDGDSDDDRESVSIDSARAAQLDAAAAPPARPPTRAGSSGTFGGGRRSADPSVGGDAAGSDQPPVAQDAGPAGSARSDAAAGSGNPLFDAFVDAGLLGPAPLPPAPFR